MASNTLQAVITADISDLKAKLAQADKLIDQYTNNISKVQNAISKNTTISQGYEKQLQDLNNQLQKGAISQEHYAKESGDVSTSLIKVQNETRDYQKELRRLQAELNRVQGASTKMGTTTQRTSKATENLAVASNKTGKTVGNATSVMTSFSQVVQDAPYGIRGVANNIQQLTAQFGYLQKSAGGSGKALKALLSSLTGPAGILLAVSLVTSLLVTYGDTMFKSSKSTEKAKEELDKFNESLDTHEELLRGVNKSRLDGSKSAVDQITKLNLLKNQLDNTNLSSHERLKAYEELQKLYPSYFSNFTEEAVLAGRLTGQYEILSAALLKKAKAQAAANLITENAEKQLVIDSKIAKLQQDIADQEIKNNELLAKGQAIRSRGANTFILQAEKGEKQVKKWREEITKLTSESGKLSTEIENLTDEVSKQGGVIDLDFDIDEDGVTAEVKKVAKVSTSIQEKEAEKLKAIKLKIDKQLFSEQQSAAKDAAELMVSDVSQIFADSGGLGAQLINAEKIEADAERSEEVIKNLENTIKTLKEAFENLSVGAAIESFVKGIEDGVDPIQASINKIALAAAVTNDAVSSSFQAMSSSLASSLETGNTVLDAFVGSLINSLGQMLAALAQSAIQQIAINQATATSSAIAGGAASGAATGPGAIFSTPAFIATLVGVVGAAFAGLASSFAHGGIVGGGSFTGDKVPAMVNSGEMILNQGQQSRLFNILSGNLSSLQGSNQGVVVSGRIEAEGTKLVTVISNTQSRNRRLGGKNKI